jgi:hypothetical protein
MMMAFTPPRRPYGVLAAPPCTIWTNAAAWMWKDVPEDVYLANKALVIRTVEICRSAERFWVLENPRGRLSSLRYGEPEDGTPLVLGDYVWEFQPSDYGDAHTKRTCLWGNFHPPTPRRVLAEGSLVGGHGKMEYPLFGVTIIHKGWHKMPKKFSKMTPEEKEDRRAWRSATPKGFAQAFFEANP